MSGRTKYKKAYSAYARVITVACGISSESAGQKVQHPRQYWASVLFTKLLVTAISVKHLAPNLDDTDHSHWDFASIASLVRNMAECWIFFHYLCLDSIGDETEWEMRLLLIRVMENRARYRMFSDLGLDPDENQFAKSQDALKEALEKNSKFTTMPDKVRLRLLRGDRLPYIQDDILLKMDVNLRAFRGYYRYLSEFVHTGPISFSRMAQTGRGHGSENKYDREAIQHCLLFATEILAGCTNEMMKLNPDAAVKVIAALGKACVDILVERERFLQFGNSEMDVA